MAEPRPFAELSDEGLLWYLNRVAFHPRGFALAFHFDDDGVAEGWSLEGTGDEVWTFAPEIEDDYFQRARRALGGPSV